MSHPTHSPPLSSRQLPLPLAPSEQMAPDPPPATVVDLPTRRVWSALGPAAQVRLRHTLLRVLQEVVRDAGQC